MTSADKQMQPWVNIFIVENRVKHSINEEEFLDKLVNSNDPLNDNNSSRKKKARRKQQGSTKPIYKGAVVLVTRSDLELKPRVKKHS